MFFQVTNLEENSIQGNVIKVTASLRTGVIEVLEGHIDMMGRIDDDILVSESIVEGRVVRKEFLIRKGVLVVSNGGLSSEAPKGTYVLVHAKEMVELTGNRNEKTIDELDQKLDKKKIELDKILEKISLSLLDLSDSENRRKIFEGKSGIKVKNAYGEVKFFEKAISLIKDIKKS
jgi:F0F1-type ATP synthase epsilon subunit